MPPAGLVFSLPHHVPSPHLEASDYANTDTQNLGCWGRLLGLIGRQEGKMGLVRRVGGEVQSGGSRWEDCSSLLQLTWDGKGPARVVYDGGFTS